MNPAEKLARLDVDILKCKECFLGKNRHHEPKWTLDTKYVILTEYPYTEKPDFMIEFWKQASFHGLKEEHFLQISTVQCSTGMNKKTKRITRPSKLHRGECKKWFVSYIKALKPQKMIAFGNIPMEELIGEFSGISERHGEIIKPKISGLIVPTVLSLPPSIYRNDPNAKSKMGSVLKTFKEIHIG